MGVSLSKGQKISLEKTAGSGLKKVFMGLGWDVAKGWFGFGGGSIDLDASCVLLDAAKKELDVIWFRQLTSKDGSVRHGGDNLTGEGEGDDERIFVDLNALPAKAQYLVFTVSSFRGQTFDKVQNASCRIVNQESNAEICKFDLSSAGSHTGMIMGVLSRESDGWHFKALGEKTSSKTVQDMLPAVRNLI